MRCLAVFTILVLAVRGDPAAGQLLPTDPPSPTLAVTPSDNPVQKTTGSDVTLVCTVRNTEEDRAGLSWHKQGGEIAKTGNVEVKRLDQLNIALIIKNATASDGGVYTCSAAVKDGHSLSYSVDIIFFSEIKFLDVNQHTSSILPTANVNISCRVSVSSGERVKTLWFRQGFLIPAKPEKYALHNGGAVLEVRNYDSAADAGEYSCQVENLNSGNAVSRYVTLGNAVENRRAFCNNMCTNVCFNLYKN